MKHKVMSILFALVLVSGFAASVAAAQDQDLYGSGDLILTKNCSTYPCRVTASNLAAIPLDTQIYYTTPAAPPMPSMLDKNIVLYVDQDNWAVGRCTLSFVTGHGLCTLSDGIGQFAGFQARVNVSVFVTSQGEFDFANYSWEGTYSFNPEQSRKR